MDGLQIARTVRNRVDAVPGVVGAVQSFGELTHAHPHIHSLVAEGVVMPETGAFLPLPKLATEPFLKLWELEVFALLLAEGKITEEVVQDFRSWKHSGFSVDQSVRLEAGDQDGIQRLIEYFLHCPFSQARIIEVTQAGQVIYKSEHNAVGRFPELTLPPAAAGTELPGCPPTAREARKGWAALIKPVYQSDPHLCPKCGSEMKIIAFIERHQREVIEKILRHSGLWEESPARGPPPVAKERAAV